MVKFSATASTILARIPGGWTAKAAKQKAKALAARKVAQADGIWSEVKDVFMDLQGYKCMYCEKPLPRPSPGGVAQGKAEYDVEHFRPKNRVEPWPTDRVRSVRGVEYAARLKSGERAGYVRLAFDPLNYGVSCKTCNSELKGDRFPITGKTKPRSIDRKTLDESERPCLILPLGDGADDPQEWLEWRGPVVGPRTKGINADRRLRARTLVDFFELDTRTDLILGRCGVIVQMAGNLKQMSTRGAGGNNARAFVDTMIDERSPFAACARAFKTLYEADPVAADHWFQLAMQYVVRKDPAIFAP